MLTPKSSGVFGGVDFSPGGRNSHSEPTLGPGSGGDRRLVAGVDDALLDRVRSVELDGVDLELAAGVGDDGEDAALGRLLAGLHLQTIHGALGGVVELGAALLHGGGAGERSNLAAAARPTRGGASREQHRRNQQ